MNKKSYALIGTLMIIVSSLVVCGTVFTYLWSGTITANAEYLMQYNSGGGMVNAEDLTVDISTSTIVAGETETFKHTWLVSSNLNAEYEAIVDFAYVVNAGSDDLTGIDLYVWMDDGVTNTTVLSVIDGSISADNTYTVDGGDTGDVFIQIIADDHLEEGSYIWDYTVDVTVQEDVP